ncbi:toprim domain-containing protein [Chryseobacterium sp. 2987]|uniref:toprim domain-containing protein n=1 Tax=Chryseobacterium sp. 2987 TaxID=2817767 RepID=UPI002864EEFE|nr:toprim domain-containing protein [Chryseobacterium sp. 2987]MDR6920201.1 5S rRNA maturation endonuclease (ribonuclease M5) [Chryseobacterium sp. 2987]
MNCKQFNSIGLEEVLAALGHLPVKQNDKEAWYLSPFGAEKQASFKVDRQNNVWYLFSEGIGGTTTDFMRKYLNTSVKGVLEWASNQNFSSFQPQIKTSRPEPNYRIDRISDIQNSNLMQYLHERGLSAKIYPLIKEIWFTIENKQFYAVGFRNRSEGWELRNAFYKGALNTKDISVLSFPGNSAAEGKTNTNVAIFEGFMDALSFAEMQKDFKGDLLVLNSIALLKRAMVALVRYPEINLFLDNDNAGKKCRDTIMEAFPHAQDFSHIYSAHKDLNQYLVEKRRRQALPAPKAGNIQQSERGCAEQQDECREETNRIKKGVRRRM